MTVSAARTRTPAAPELALADVEGLIKLNDEPRWLAERRRAAWELYESLPMPSTSDEAWRRTDYRRIRWAQAGSLLRPDGAADLKVIPAAHSAPLLDDRQGGRVACVDSSGAARELDAALTAKGVIFTDLNTAVREHGDLVAKSLMTQAVKAEDGKFAALHAALWTHGVFLYVPRGVTVELPLHSVFYPVSAGLTLGHILIVLEEGADVTYMHEYASLDREEQAAYVGATEILVSEGARLRYVALQNWAGNLYEFSHQRARVQRDGTLDWVIGAMGGKLVKTFMEIDLDGKGSSGR